MMRKLVSLSVLIFCTVGAVSCAAAPTPVTQSRPVVRVLPSPTPTAPCDAVENLAPERPTIPRPSVVPLPVITPQPTLASARSGLVDAKFYSQALDREMPLLIYLPSGYYDSPRRYPTLYLLSGFAGDYREWATYGACRVLDVLVRGGQAQPMILVMPEGDKSWWFNHAPPPASDGKRWGDYVWQEVAGYVDANYRTLARRESRAIGGLSAGGQSALMLGLTHPEVFSVVGAHSPSFRGADGSVPAFGAPEYFNQYDPLWLVQNRDTWKQLTIWIDIGAEDQQWGKAIEDLHATLDRLGVAHEFQSEWRGAHESTYWAEHLQDYLRWYASKLAGE